jgi:signal transduction histidine kinase
MNSHLYPFHLFIKGGVLRTQVSLNTVVADVLWRLTGEALKRRVALEREMEAELPDVVADSVQLQQVVQNLVISAFDAMDRVLDRPKRLSVRAHRDGADAVVVEIRDTGIGITEPNRAFEQLFTTTGLGTSLSICRSIVEAHRGALWVEHHEGAGTGVCFRLPVEQKGGAAAAHSRCLRTAT